ncbi:MAG TPA: hypothetical protein VLG50_02125 [Candidatus Saccharimonadales bacterium]|nr:hypothetical protein [Candidatus Saccharimonadales bacterium]
MLSDYIVSFIPGFCTNVRLPQKWTQWYLIVKQCRNGGNRFIATNEEEYIKKMSALLPHLNYTDIQYIYHEIVSKDEFGFAAPPLIVRDSYRHMKALKRYEENTYELKEKDKVVRLPTSYSNHQLHGEYPNEPLIFAEKAIQYANTHWKDVIKVQPHMEYQTYVFSDPSSPFGIGRIYSIYVALNNIHSKKRSEHEQINDQVSVITVDDILFHEINTDYSEKSYNTTEDGSFLNKQKHLIPSYQTSNFPGLPICDKIVDYIEKYEQRIRHHNNIEKRYRVTIDRSLLEETRK